ncbi:class I SAM-dependent methyltransferase [Kordiimonas lipolytica]|uniref:Class I SAM-dependent methyltransferase n=1 Tax=Kordiimonas lipolytica TaxID=1662421 RepID=A0ABV8U9F2_9PROT|nr:class I SAM-dependent methyltransferase [Kordiimonas lipolytica]
MIDQVVELQNNREHNSLKIAETLRYMAAMYVKPLRDHVHIEDAVLCDCAAGFGWLAFAYLLSGGKHAILVEPHAGKLEASRKLAAVLGVADRCEFRNDLLQDLSLADKSVDVFASIETLEHVGRKNIRAAVANIARVTRRVVLLTAPNQLSPLVSHDAGVPFSHWLPIGWRRPFCRMLGVSHSEYHHFPAPWHLGGLRKDFRPSASALVFRDFRAWRDHYPIYSPYAGGRWKMAPPVG